MACQPDTVNREAELSDVKAALEKVKAHCSTSSVSWASDLLKKADEDGKNKTHNGNYIGYVSAININGEKLLYTNFMMGSGGILFYTFNCKGDTYVREAEDFLQKAVAQGDNFSNIIYSNVPVEVLKSR